MPEWIIYLLKFNLSLALVWLFYQVFLRRLTFYNWNRIYLFVYSAICFLIPFININPWLNSSGFVNIGIVHNMPTVSHYVPASLVTTSVERIRFGYPFMLGMVLLIGSLVMGFRLLMMYISLVRISNRAKLLVAEPVQIFETSRNVSPFSFGNKIFIQPDALPGEELETIIRHEFIHVKQRHSFDILYSEILCMVAWYSPFAWLIRHAIRQNLEFIADNMIINNGTDKKAYQYLLLKVTGQAPISISNQFNLSSLKNRMVMMNKSKSARTQLFKFLLIVPIVAILLMAFRSASEKIIPTLLQKTAIIATVDTTPPAKAKAKTPPAPVPPPPVPSKMPAAVTGTIKEVPVEFTIVVDKNSVATIRQKNGKTETYDFKKPEQANAFNKKYGSLPPAPPVISEVEPAELTEVSAAPVVATVPTAIAMDAIATTTPVTAGVSNPSKASVGVSAPVEEIDVEVKGETLLDLSTRTTQADVDKQVDALKAKGYFIEISNLVWKEGKLVLAEGTLGVQKKKKAHFKVADFKQLIFSLSSDKNNETGIDTRLVNGQLNIN